MVISSSGTPTVPVMLTSSLVTVLSTDTPLVGDWNGDGTDTVGIYRNGNFYLRNTNGAGNADLVFGYGIIHRYSLGR